MKKSLFLVLTLLFGCLSVQAVPAHPGKRMIKKSDGTQVMATFRGDEHFSFYATEDGQYYVSSTDGTFKEIAREKIEEIWSSRLQNANASRMRSARNRRAMGIPQSDPIVGNKKGLVILVEYPDKGFSMENPKDYYQRVFNEKGYSENGFTGSVRDYFLDQSYNQLDIEFTVAGPIMMSHNMSYYGAPTDYSNDERPNEMIKEACEGADPDVNFADFDWDNNGEVDQVFVIYAGNGQNYEEWGVSKNTIWPHESHLKAWETYIKLDGVMLDTYACSCELGMDQDSDGNVFNILDGIGTPCHEFSHCLGLPDFYDTNGQNNFGTGNWDVMCSGSYINNAKTPAGYTSYERMFAGWLTPVELSDMTRINGMKALTDEPTAYILYNEANRNEFYLLENRQPKKWDSKIGGHGLLVIHGYYDKELFTKNDVNVNPDKQCMTIIPANNSTRGYSGMPFPGSKGVTSLTNYTTPAATLYDNNLDGKKLMSKPIDNIKESEDGLISFVACRPEMDIPVPGDGTYVEGTNSFKVTWPAVTGATSYELELTEMASAADDPSEALVQEFKFEKWKGNSDYVDVCSTNSKKTMSDYGLPGWGGSKLFISPEKMQIGSAKDAGYLKTPTWDVPQSSEMTIVLGAKLFKEGTPVKGKVRVAFGNVGDNATYEEIPFELTKDGHLIFTFSIRKDLFWLEIHATTRMYLNYLAIYDGIWTAEQLGIGTSAARTTARRATTITTYTTDTNSYTFENLNTKNRYFYRVRAFGEENTVSLWSEEKAFTFPATGIRTIIADELRQQTFDLNGRRIETPQKGLYIRNGKKFIK